MPRRLITRADRAGPLASRPRAVQWRQERRRAGCCRVQLACAGVIASRGLAVGRAVTLKAAEIAVVEAGQGIGHESAEFERARGEVRARLNQLAQHSQGAAKEVITAHLEFIDDWELVASARRAISRGKSAAFAWRRAVRDSADTLRALGDPRMSERVDDLIDLESQVLLALSGEAPVTIPQLPERAILVAEDLKPSQLVSLDATKLAGICLAAGGPTSHVAILAAAMGVPALVALGENVLSIEDGAWLVLDAEQGNLTDLSRSSRPGRRRTNIDAAKAAPAKRAGGRACGLSHGRWRAYRSVRQPRLPRRSTSRCGSRR